MPGTVLGSRTHTTVNKTEKKKEFLLTWVLSRKINVSIESVWLPALSLTGGLSAFKLHKLRVT